MFRLVVFGLILAIASRGAPEDQAWLEQARAAAAAGDFRAAREAAGKALRQNADLAEAEVILGLADTADEQLSSAEKHFAKSVFLQPSNYRGHAYLGSTYLRQQRLTEAQRSFARVLELNPGNIVAQYNLGVIASLQKKTGVAASYFRAVYQSNPSDAAVLVALLECQLELKQSRAARDSAQKLGELLPADSPLLLHTGTTLASHGEYTMAIGFLRRYVAGNPTSQDARYNLGLALLHTGALKEAESVTRQLVNDSRSADSYNLLGLILEQRSERKSAVDAFAEAARLAPGNAEFYIDYGRALIDANDLEKAVAMLSGRLEEMPKSVRLRLGLGAALYLCGRYDDAARTVLEGIHQQPRGGAAYDLLGKMFASAVEQQTAIMQVFREYLQTEPGNAGAHAQYAEMLYSKASGEDPFRFVEAKHHLRRALALEPKLGQAQIQLGAILQSEGKLAESVVSYRKGIELCPNDATSRYRLATAYQKLGDRARAQKELEAFRALKEAARTDETQRGFRRLLERND